MAVLISGIVMLTFVCDLLVCFPVPLPSSPPCVAASCAGFPIFTFVLLTRAFATEKTGGVVGFLWRRIVWLRGTQKIDETITYAESIKWAQKADAADADAPDAPSDADTFVEAYAEVKAKAKPKSTKPLETPAARALRISREDSYGFLFLALRGDAFTWSLQVFFVHAYFAVVDVFVARNGLLRIFLFALIAVVQTTMLAWELPYERWKDNLTKVCVGLATICHSALLLGQS